MKEQDLEYYFDLLNKNPEELTVEEKKLLKNELGQMEEYNLLDKRINDALIKENLEPSSRVKENLDKAFEDQFGRQNTQHHGIVSIDGLKSKKPLNVFAAAASITIVLFLSFQVGFNGLNPKSVEQPLLADSINHHMPDSNYWPSDTLSAPF
jgi:uncharacterized membrane protein